MRTRTIGSLEVPVVGLGCNNFGRRIDEEGTRRVLDAAVEAGVTFLDTANNYGDGRSEEFIGRWLEGRRDRALVATKFGGMRPETGREGGAAPAYVRQAIEESLVRLRTDHIDLYQLHVPDEHTPIADTMEVLDGLVGQGKVREIGCSNFTATQLREAHGAVTGGAARFVSVQNELNLLDRDDADDGLAEAERLGIAYIPYSPLASGLLTGKYRRGEPPPAGTRIAGWSDDDRGEVLTDAAFDRLDALTRFGDERGLSLLDLAFAWLLSRPAVASVIAGATRPAQVVANAAAGDAALSPDDLAAIETILKSG